MNKNFLMGAVILLVLAFILGYWWVSGQSSRSLPPSTSAKVTPDHLPISSSASQTAIPSSVTDTSPDHQAEVEREKKVWDLWLATPIGFYGKVVDTDGNSVAGATASISLIDTAGSGEGHTKLQRTSDTQGLFSVSGHGLGLVVQVSKEGYYSTDKSSGNFTYVKEAGKLSVYNDPNAPAVFVLKKRGQTETLIVTRGTIGIAGNGTPRQMSLTTGHTWIVPNGDIILQAWIEDQGIPVNSSKPYDWRCKITVPGGGIQPRTGGDLNFEAPSEGYQASDEIDMPSTSPQWNSNASRHYFVQLGNGDYARIDFTISAQTSYQFEITSYLNPTPGHRNLEYDPQQQTNK